MTLDCERKQENHKVTNQTHEASFSISAERLDHSSSEALSENQLNGYSLEGIHSIFPFLLILSVASLSVDSWETSTRSGLFEASQWLSTKYGPQSSKSLD